MSHWAFRLLGGVLGFALTTYLLWLLMLWSFAAPYVWRTT